MPDSIDYGQKIIHLHVNRFATSGIYQRYTYINYIGLFFNYCSFNWLIGLLHVDFSKTVHAVCITFKQEKFVQAENSFSKFTRNRIKVLRLPLGTISPVLALSMLGNVTLSGGDSLASLRASSCVTKRGPELYKVQYDGDNW